jgi:hypothetical protein
MPKEVWVDKIEECYRRAADARRLSDSAADPSNQIRVPRNRTTLVVLSPQRYGPIPMLIPEDYEGTGQPETSALVLLHLRHSRQTARRAHWWPRANS